MESDSPVRLAYDLFGKDASGNYTRQSWDLATVVCAIEGANEYWEVKRGRALINAEHRLVDVDEPLGYTEWLQDANGKDGVLVERVPPEEIAEMLNSRMIKAKRGMPLQLEKVIPLRDIVFVLYQLAGEPRGNIESAVEEWAADDLLKVDHAIDIRASDETTYGSLAALLYHYNLLLGSQNVNSAAKDKMDDLNDYQTAFDWTIAEGLVINDSIALGTPVTRGQFAEILIRYCSILFADN